MCAAIRKIGKWGKLEITDSEYMNIHMAATALHYGQEAFEGIKASGKGRKDTSVPLGRKCKTLEPFG